MLFKQQTLRQIATGEVDLAFRRWSRPRVKPGTELRTSIGLVRVDAVERVSLSSISERDAARAGNASRAELLRLLRGRDGGVYRITLSRGGADPRIALRRQSRLSADDLETLRGRLDRMDRAAGSPWTRGVLGLIRDHPGVRAADLATSQGDELRRFKSRVRRLKELGLTESLEVGYRLSPRGRALLERLE